MIIHGLNPMDFDHLGSPLVTAGQGRTENVTRQGPETLQKIDAMHDVSQM